MKFLDWIKYRNNREPLRDELDPKTYGHASWQGLFAEMREDYTLAKQRDETGREPECGSPKTDARRGPSRER